MSFEATLHLLAEQNIFLFYTLISLAVLLEGEVAFIVSGALFHLGVADGLPLIVAFVFGGFGKSVVMYQLGRLIDMVFPESTFLKKTEEKIHKIFPHIKEKPFLSIFLSKFIYGMNNAIIIFSGYIRFPFKKLFVIESASLAVFGPVLFLIGYVLSFTVASVGKYFRKISLILLACLVGFFVLQSLVRAVLLYLQKKQQL